MQEIIIKILTWLLYLQIINNSEFIQIINLVNINNYYQDTIVSVTKVIDGDTIETSDGQKIRYIGIDSPEMKNGKSLECFSLEAKLANEALVLGKKVTLFTDKSNKDRYGRLLRYVWVDQKFVNQELVAGGYARAKPYNPDISYKDLFVSTEKEARSKGLGLWGHCSN